MSDKDMVTVYERRDGSKPGLWLVYWYLGWDVFYSFSLAVGITSKNTMLVIIEAFCLLCFLGLTVWQLNHLTWSITDYRVRISTDLAKETHIEQSDQVKHGNYSLKTRTVRQRRFAWLPDFGSM